MDTQIPQWKRWFQNNKEYHNQRCLSYYHKNKIKINVRRKILRDMKKK